MPTAPLVSLRDVDLVAAHDGSTLLHVDALDVHAGDRLCLVGPSGAGKSLLLAALAGRPPAGVLLRGTRRAAPGLRTGSVPQRGQDALHPLLPVATQLRRATGRPAADVAAALARLGLTEPATARRRPAELSGGQAQRAAVALAALSGAQVVLADEPTSALDPASRDETVALLLSLVAADAPVALVVATHDTAVPALLGARTMHVEDGRLRTGDRPDEDASTRAGAAAPTGAGAP